MNKSFIISRVLLGTALCLALAVPAMAEGTPATKSSPAPKTSAPAPAKSSGKKATAKSDSPEQLQAQLDSFAQKTIGSINRCVLPSSSKKESLCATQEIFLDLTENTSESQREAVRKMTYL